MHYQCNFFPKWVLMAQTPLAFFESLHNDLHEKIKPKPQSEPYGEKDKSFPEIALILLKEI